MSIFRKKKSGPAAPTPPAKPAPEAKRASVFDTDYPIDRTNWFQVFSACLGRSAAVQQGMADFVVKNRNWNVDFSQGTLSFGEDAYPVQFLGSESSVSNSWMWGWNNVNNFDGSLISAAEDIRRIGEKWQLEVFTTAQFELDDTFNGHTLSIAATGVLPEGYAYYKGPHDNGAVLMLVRPEDSRVFAPVGLKDFVDWTMSSIQTYYIDHKIFLDSFLMWNGTPYEYDNKRYIAYFGDQRLLIDLEQADEFLRIKGIKTLGK